MQSRLMKFKATKQLQQLETIYVITGVNNIPQLRNRISFDGCTTAGNVWSNAPLSNLNTGWIVYQEKRDLFGEMRISIGEARGSWWIARMTPWSRWPTTKPVLQCGRSAAKVIIDWVPMDNLLFLVLESGVPWGFD